MTHLVAFCTSCSAKMPHGQTDESRLQPPASCTPPPLSLSPCWKLTQDYRHLSHRTSERCAQTQCCHSVASGPLIHSAAATVTSVETCHQDALLPITPRNVWRYRTFPNTLPLADTSFFVLRNHARRRVRTRCAFSPPTFADKMIARPPPDGYYRWLLAPNMLLLTDSVYFHAYYANERPTPSAAGAPPAVPWIQNRGSVMAGVFLNLY